MFGNILHFIINIVFSLFGIALIIRAWMYAIRLHPFNPYAQAVLRVTDWFVQPLKKIIPTSKFIDWPSLAAAWVTALVFLLLTFFVLTGHLPVVNGLPGALIASLLTVIKWGFNLILWLTLIQVVLSWVNPMAPLMPVLQTLTAPLLDPIRRILPTPGGIDFAPLVLLIIAQIVMMMLEGFAYNLFGV